MKFSHKPVMIEEVSSGLKVKKPSVYVDLTSGGGGHAERIIADNPGIRAVLMDRDGDAVEFLKDKFKDNGNVTVVRSGFSDLDKVLFLLKIKSADIIFADLGVSSFQFDTPSRGFSVSQDGPFDMRMDRDGALTALDLVKQSSEGDLRNILSEYAQEREAGRIARVLKKCAEEGMTSTLQFANEIRKAKRFGKAGIDPSTQVFMALRMAVNDEMGQLGKMLEKAFVALAPEGVMGVITFHSTEDRAVKRFFRDRRDSLPFYSESDKGRPYIYGRVDVDEMVQPSNGEISENPRSRSAKLRILRKH